MVSGDPTAASASQSVVPPKPLASDTVTELPRLTDVGLGVSVAGGSMVNVSADDVPPQKWAGYDPRRRARVVVFRRRIDMTNPVG